MFSVNKEFLLGAPIGNRHCALSLDKKSNLWEKGNKFKVKNFLTILILAFLSLNVTGCFSIGARSRMEGRHIKTYPGVDAYSGFVTGAFKQMDTSDAIFFGILISPHLAAATLDLPLTFIHSELFA